MYREITLSDTHATDALLALFSGEILAIRILDTYGIKECEKLASLALSQLNLEPYLVEPAFKRASIPAYELDGAGPSLIDEYHDVSTSRTLRALMAPAPLPSDVLRLSFDELMPHGAMLERFLPGRAAPTGQIRALLPGDGPGVLWHVDLTRRDLRNVAPAFTAPNFSFVTTLAADSSEGHLVLSDLQIQDEQHYQNLMDPSSSYGLDEKKLPPPVLHLPPIPGTTVLFDSMRPHRVEGVRKQPRVTDSGLIAWHGLNAPIRLYR